MQLDTRTSMPVVAPLSRVMPGARTFRVKGLHGRRHGSRNKVLCSANGGADNDDMEHVRDKANNNVDLRHLGIYVHQTLTSSSPDYVT